MLIFIDESGIHKAVDNSAFALVYIEFDNYSMVEKSVIDIEKELKIDFFHWSQTVWKVKEKFLQKTLNLDYKVKIAVVKNPVNTSIELERILIHMLIERNIRGVYIDGKKPKWYAKKIKKILRDKSISVKKLKTVNDKSYAGIRIADMVAGLVRWHFDKKNLDDIEKYYKKLEEKTIVLIK